MSVASAKASLQQTCSQEGLDYDGAVPIPCHNDDGYEWWDVEEGRLLEEQLFSSGSDAQEADAAARNLAIVGQHSALESYARGVGTAEARDPAWGNPRISF